MTYLTIALVSVTLMSFVTWLFFNLEDTEDDT